MVEQAGQPSPVLDVGIARADGVVVVAVSGELDADTAPQVSDTVAAAFDADAAALVLDLSDVVFFGSAGLAMLLELRLRADGSGRPFAVVATRRAVLKPLAITSVAAVLNLFGSTDEALGWVSTSCPGRRAPRA